MLRCIYRLMSIKHPKPQLMIICGPTGSGKTSLAIEMARQFNGEIISVDSMQVYKTMDIGTAKPTLDEQAYIHHHLIDIIAPHQPFDAAQFAKLAHASIIELQKRDIIPFLVGGTGLYIKALVHGLFRSKPVDEKIRRRLKEKATVHGSDFIYKELKTCDPVSAEKIHPSDAYRIIRALEIYEATEKAISTYHREHKFADSPYNFLKIGLQMKREILYDRINRRVDAMVDAGFVTEVRGLLDRGYSAALKSMQAIGYRHMVDFIEGRISWDEAIRTMKRDTRRYAKRQLTWFRKDPEIVWVEPERVNDIQQLIKSFLQVPPRSQ